MNMGEVVDELFVALEVSLRPGTLGIHVDRHVNQAGCREARRLRNEARRRVGTIKRKKRRGSTR